MQSNLEHVREEDTDYDDLISSLRHNNIEQARLPFIHYILNVLFPPIF